MATPDVITRQNRRVYSTEQLHRLRGTVSTPKLNESIEEHDGDEANLIKEHVLRGSKSFAARSWKSRASGHSLRIPSNKENRAVNLSDSERPSFSQHANALAPILGEIATNNQQIIRTGPYGRARRSPTPSLKRKKVEAIVRAHGSPTHVRVTAGGRIVPSEQSPLCHPRYGYSAIKTNGGLIKFAPNHPMGKSQWTQATQNGFVAQDADGKLCQIVDGTILPLREIEGALQLYMPAPNLNVTQRTSSVAAAPQSHIPQAGVDDTIEPLQGGLELPKPTIKAQINALELEYSKLDHELKDVDKTEVMHGRTMGKAAKDALISKRRELVTTLDNVRRALKSLKQQNLGTDAPVSPHILHNKHVSPPAFSRLPLFLQPRQLTQELLLPPAAPYTLYGQFPGQQPNFAGSYGFGQNPSPEAGYSAMAWAMPPPAMFAPPPPFDGPVPGISLPISMNCSTADANVEKQHPDSADNRKSNTMYYGPVQPVGGGIPQALPVFGSPRQEHALPNEVSESKPMPSSRSNLNPMSPEYRPLHASPKECSTRVEMQLGPSLDKPSSTPLTQALGIDCRNKPRCVQKSEETIGPSKKSTHLQSSSVSSFETADFFPRNTQEYSTRQRNKGPHADKDCTCDEVSTFATEAAYTSLHNGESATMNSIACSSPSRDLPAAPPGTPVGHDATVCSASLPVIVDGATWNRQSNSLEAPADRDVHNVSPKAKRNGWQFIEEHPDQEQTTTSSSPTKMYACVDELCVNSSPQDTLDFSHKSRDWIEGYRAGLNRHPVGSSRMGEFLDGYCSGLLKSSPTNIRHSTGSPTKPITRRPSPVPNHPRSSAGVTLSNRLSAAARPMLSPRDAKSESLNALKQAVLAPHNENTILTPAADGPHVNEAMYNLGAWAKERSIPPSLIKPFPSVVLSAAVREHDEVPSANFGSDTPTQTQPVNNETEPQPSSPTVSAKNLSTSVLRAKGVDTHRISSVTSMESRFYRQWPGARVVSPHLEWKSGSSVSHQTGLATGFFAHAQFDGSPQSQRPGSVTSVAGMPEPKKPLPPSGRFREVSVDVIAAPAPLAQASSIPLSPKLSPARKPKTSAKASSPARMKFENIAEKVGINVSTDTSSPPGGPGKRRWRDVWRGSTKKDCA